MTLTVKYMFRGPVVIYFPFKNSGLGIFCNGVLCGSFVNKALILKGLQILLPALSTPPLPMLPGRDTLSQRKNRCSQLQESVLP